MGFNTSRRQLISNGTATRIHDLALGILREIGVEVRDAEALHTLRARGFRSNGSRLLVDPPVANGYVERMRGWIEQREPSPAPERPDSITLSVSSYALYVHDLPTGSILPMTTPRLIEMCKLVDSLAGEGVVNAPPGIPTEVAPELQPLAQYRIAANTARQGAAPVDPTSAATVNYLLDMADVMGRPVRGLPVYVPSPLRLGGESLSVVLACLDRLDEIWISSMPAAGATAPLQPFGALALATAEVLGAAILVHELTGKPAKFSINIFPLDLRFGSMVFGSPENLLFQMLCQDLNAFYGWQWRPAPDNIHVMAKRPDAQAAAEKAAIMALGASLGARHFSCAGTLSLDEIFSPEQLLLDCEVRDWVARCVRGVTLAQDEVDDWIAEIRAGLQRGFMGLDSTLDHYKEQVWYPQRFERRAVGPWMAEGQPHLAERLREEVQRRIAGHEFALDRDRHDALDRIYQAAAAAAHRG